MASTSVIKQNGLSSSKVCENGGQSQVLSISLPIHPIEGVFIPIINGKSGRKENLLANKNIIARCIRDKTSYHEIKCLISSWIEREGNEIDSLPKNIFNGVARGTDMPHATT